MDSCDRLVMRATHKISILSHISSWSESGWARDPRVEKERTLRSKNIKIYNGQYICDSTRSKSYPKFIPMKRVKSIRVLLELSRENLQPFLAGNLSSPPILIAADKRSFFNFWREYRARVFPRASYNVRILASLECATVSSSSRSSTFAIASVPPATFRHFLVTFPSHFVHVFPVR